MRNGEDGGMVDSWGKHGQIHRHLADNAFSLRVSVTFTDTGDDDDDDDDPKLLEVSDEHDIGVLR